MSNTSIFVTATKWIWLSISFRLILVFVILLSLETNNINDCCEHEDNADCSLEDNVHPIDEDSGNCVHKSYYNNQHNNGEMVINCLLFLRLKHFHFFLILYWFSMGEEGFTEWVDKKCRGWRTFCKVYVQYFYRQIRFIFDINQDRNNEELSYKKSVGNIIPFPELYAVQQYYLSLTLKKLFFIESNQILFKKCSTRSYLKIYKLVELVYKTKNLEPLWLMGRGKIFTLHYLAIWKTLSSISYSFGILDEFFTPNSMAFSDFR